MIKKTNNDSSVLSDLMDNFKQLRKDMNQKMFVVKSLAQLYKDLDTLGPITINVENKECYSSWSGTKSVLPVPIDFALYDYAIKFFNVIAKFQDSGVLEQAINKDVLIDKKSVNKLAALIKNCGRSENGMVRSKPGKRITGNDVYLGGVFDVPTLTINQLKALSKQKSSPKNNWVQWVVQIHQLQNFLKCNIRQINALMSPIVIAEQEDNNMYKRFFERIGTYNKQR